jgi:hypothetical protein
MRFVPRRLGTPLTRAARHAAGINYETLQGAAALDRLHELERLSLHAA